MRLKLHLLVLFCTISYCASAQLPMAKIDINMEGRSETEVNQEGYKAWFITRVPSASINVLGVTFTLTVKQPGTSTMRTSWSKALVQSPYYTRLVNDGVKVDNDSMLKFPNTPAAIELRISGLPKGTHTIQTYHNIWEDTTKVNHAPMNVYLNGNLIYSRVKRSVQVKKNSDATILMTKLNVTEDNQEMVLLFEADKNFTPLTGKTADLNVCINALELNTDDAAKLAQEPTPANGDMHVNADTGFVDLQWRPSLNNYAKTHTLYFGLDSTTVATATVLDAGICKGTQTLDKNTYRAGNLYNLNCYYWRVDETDSSGVITKGKVWNFRPRHLAFRGAEGYGRFAIGGRGGKVVEVTNLNDDGPGSFREAVTNNIGPRTVVFNVSGRIILNSRLTINQKYVTIAGQTAPGKGICFSAAPLGLGPDGICRFVRMRLGAGTTYDGMGMAGVDHGILDHASISWTIDESFSSRGAKNITLQRTLISEALNVAGHQNYPAGTAHGYAGSIGGDVGSFHHNLLAHNEGRNWSLAGGLDGNGYYAGKMDIFNMVVYNWGGRATDGGANQVNFVNNYYKKGASSSQNYVLKAQLEGVGKGSQSYYYAGNILENTNGTLACDGTNSTCASTYVLSNGQILDWTVFVDKPFFPSYAKIESAKDAYKSVTSDVGCTMPLFDDHDKRIINETLTGTYTYKGSVSGKPGLIDHQDDQGGYENYPAETRPNNFDSDHDGLPDWWETLYGSNPNSAAGDFSDANADTDKNGYTALEDYLEWMSVPHYFIPQNISDTIELADFTKGYVNPAFSCENPGNFNLNFIDSKVRITPTMNAKGINYLDLKATDTAGSVFIRRIGIFIGESPLETSVKLPSYTENLQASVYPSVFDNELTVHINSGINTTVNVVLSDMMGRKILSNSFAVVSGKNNFTLKVPATTQSQLFLLSVSDKNNHENYLTAKVVKK